MEKIDFKKNAHLEPRGRVVSVARPLAVVDDDDGRLHGSLVLEVSCGVEWEKQKKKEKI